MTATAAGQEVMHAATKLSDEQGSWRRPGDSVSRNRNQIRRELMKKTRLLDKPERA